MRDVGGGEHVRNNHRVWHVFQYIHIRTPYGYRSTRNKTKHARTKDCLFTADPGIPLMFPCNLYYIIGIIPPDRARCVALRRPGNVVCPSVSDALRYNVVFKNRSSLNVPINTRFHNTRKTRRKSKLRRKTIGHLEWRLQSVTCIFKKYCRGPKFRT